MRYAQGMLLFCLANLVLAQEPIVIETPDVPKAASTDACGSYLWDACFKLDYKYHGQPRPYQLQPGDVVLATDKNAFWKLTHDMAFAFEPHNSAIIVSKPDGSLAVLEAGANDTLKIHVLDAYPHLSSYADKGPVWIRKRKEPLTECQNAKLTEFAMMIWGRRFALIRLGAQLTPIRQRGPLRTYFLGKPQGDRSSYWCSETVTEAGVWAGIMDPITTRPGATYPADLFYNHSHNFYINQHPPLACGWEPPARWDYKTCRPCQ